MEPQKLRINDPNRFVTVRGKQVRTPFEMIVRTEKELNFFKSIFHAQGIQDWSLSSIEETKPEPKKVEAKPKPKPKPKKKAEDMSTLEKLAEDKLEDEE